MLTEIDSSKIFQNALRGKEGCLFCSPVEGMVFQETENFRILFDTFPVSPGHLMITSKNHYSCAGEIPVEFQEELLNLKNSLKQKMKKVFSFTILYEHGKAGCCMNFNPYEDRCEHFHLHLVPIKSSIVKILKSKFSSILISDYRELQKIFLKRGAYLFFEEFNDNMYVFPVEREKIPPHFLRSLVCQELGVSHRSNWQNYEESELFFKSYDLIKNFIKF